MFSEPLSKETYWPLQCHATTSGLQNYSLFFESKVVRSARETIAVRETTPLHTKQQYNIAFIDQQSKFLISLVTYIGEKTFFVEDVEESTNPTQPYIKARSPIPYHIIDKIGQKDYLATRIELIDKSYQGFAKNISIHKHFLLKLAPKSHPQFLVWNASTPFKIYEAINKGVKTIPLEDLKKRTPIWFLPL